MELNDVVIRRKSVCGDGKYEVEKWWISNEFIKIVNGKVIKGFNVSKFDDEECSYSYDESENGMKCFNSWFCRSEEEYREYFNNEIDLIIEKLKKEIENI